MTCRYRLANATAVVACASILVLPASAGAVRAGEGTFQQVYPAASGICARMAAGTATDKRLVSHKAEVLSDCALLQSTYTSATSAMVASRATLAPQIAADTHALADVCSAGSKYQFRACSGARAADEPAIKALTAQLNAAKRSFHASIEAGRARFWAAIEAFPPRGLR